MTTRPEGATPGPTAARPGQEKPFRPEDERCADCGSFTDLWLADRWICPACYEGRGSCCSEFVGGDEK